MAAAKVGPEDQTGQNGTAPSSNPNATTIINNYYYSINVDAKNAHMLKQLLGSSCPGAAFLVNNKPNEDDDIMVIDPAEFRSSVKHESNDAATSSAAKTSRKEQTVSSSSRSELDQSVDEPCTSSKPTRKRLPVREVRAAESSVASSTKEFELPLQTINQLFKTSFSIECFSIRLMTLLFTEQELLQCHNVSGRTRNNKGPKLAALDERRINYIRRLVDQRSGPDKEKIWSACLLRMNHDIRDRKIRSRAPQWHAVDLKESSLYQENQLEFARINRIFQVSQSMPRFATNLMMLLFKPTELRQCYNVYGRVTSSVTPTMPALDAKRVELIRKIVKENSQDNERFEDTWRLCVALMNDKIRQLKYSSS